MVFHFGFPVKGEGLKGKLHTLDIHGYPWLVWCSQMHVESMPFHSHWVCTLVSIAFSDHTSSLLIKIPGQCYDVIWKRFLPKKYPTWMWAPVSILTLACIELGWTNNPGCNFHYRMVGLVSSLLQFSLEGYFYLFFFAFCFSCFSALPASFLFCFSAFVLLCLSTSTVLLFLFFSHVFLLLYFLLLCFSASCLYCLFVFFFSFALFSPVCILNETLTTLGETQRTPKEILTRTPDKKPLHDTLNEP